MTKEATFLKMKTPADLLAVNFFASTGQLKGKFVQEINPPWTIWWQPQTDQGLIGRLGTMIKGELPQPESVWEPGQPNGELKEISWLDLFRKAVIKKTESRAVANEVVVVTPEKDIFYAVVKQHFMLQQGQVEFAVFDSGREYYMLRIQNPSLWVFNTITSPNWVWYNLVPGQSGIYVETGHYIHDISGDSCFNQFQITESGILLIQKDGRLLTLKPKWRKGESLIKVQFAGPSIAQKNDQDIISLKPMLRPSDHQLLPILWKVDDQQRFKAILLNESLNAFSSYQAVICKDGSIWVLARGKHADRGLASVLTDAFKPFVEICPRVFVPDKQTLAPRLSSERLHEILAQDNTDFIVIEEEQATRELMPTLITSADWAAIEEFVTLQAEQAAKRAEALQSTWKFEFKELKKKKQVVEVEVKDPIEKLEAASEDGQVGSGGVTARRRTGSKKINLADVPEPGTSELSGLRLELENIDRGLLQNVADSGLWRQRAEICRRMRLRVSAVASLMNAALLAKDNQNLAECVFEYAAMRPEFKALAAENISEVEKGRLLADIRRETVNSEFHYALLLCFAAKFNDRDIFEQAVAAMKTSFPGEKREFYNFNEIRSASGGGMNVENRVELLNEDNLPKISMNVRKFLQQVGCCSSLSSIAMARYQLHKVLTFHLSRKSADNLVSVSNFGMSIGSRTGIRAKKGANSGVFTYFCTMIDNWPDCVQYEDLSSSVARWARLLVMEKIRETPLKDFFTGDLYKPPYMFNRLDEKNGMLQIGWIQKLAEDQFPPVSDGRPLARAIYYRFADGSPDWDEYFKRSLKSGNADAISKTQRLLLLMVSEFGPHPAFKKYIMPLSFDRPDSEKWDIFDLTMYCDMYRLCLAYRQPIDEQRLFNKLIVHTPMPPHGWEDFRDSAEWIILCLLLTSSPVRRFQLDNLINRVMRWLQEAERQNDFERYAEALTVMSFLNIGILADLVPEKLELHQLLEKRKVIWMEHAFAASAKGKNAFPEWQKACGF
ncbi:MAG: hypothetical protein AB1403_02890 [Candidatus Riflebacteria bacterium]